MKLQAQICSLHVSWVLETLEAQRPRGQGLKPGSGKIRWPLPTYAYIARRQLVGNSLQSLRVYPSHWGEGSKKTI